MMKSSVLAVAEKGLKLFCFLCLMSVRILQEHERNHSQRDVFLRTVKDVLVSKLDRFSLL